MRRSMFLSLGLALCLAFTGCKSDPEPAPAAQTETVTAKIPGRSAPADVRTLAGRARYEGSLLAALAEAPDFTGVATLTEKVGGTNLQARAALNRLIEAGKVTWTGRARSTRYRLASLASQ